MKKLLLFTLSMFFVYASAFAGLTGEWTHSKELSDSRGEKYVEQYDLSIKNGNRCTASIQHFRNDILEWGMDLNCFIDSNNYLALSTYDSYGEYSFLEGALKESGDQLQVESDQGIVIFKK